MISSIGNADIGVQIAMMETQLGQDDKHTSEAMRKSAEDAEDTADQQELDAMSDKADAAFAGSLISAAGDFASAGYSAHSAGVMGDSIGATGAAADATKAAVRTDEADAQLTGACTKLLTAGMTMEGNDDDASIEQAKQAQTHAQTELQDASDDKKGEQDAIGKSLDFALSYEQAQNAATAAAIRA